MGKMSWIVEHLVMSKDSIRSAYEDGTVDEDSYTNSILVEKKIAELYDNNLLSDLDMLVIDAHRSMDKLIYLKTIFRDRHTISNAFSQICERVAFFLGGYFTDDGFLDNLAKYYRLTKEEKNIVSTYIKSKYKHKLKRLKID